MKIDRRNKTLRFVLGSMDLGLVYLAYYLTIFPFNLLHESNISLSDFVILIPFVIAVSFILFESFGVFKYGDAGYAETIVSIAIAGLISNGIAVVIAFGLNRTMIPSKLFVISWLMGLCLFMPYKYILHMLYKKIFKIRKIVIVGTGKQVERIQEKTNNLQDIGYQITDVFNEVSHQALDCIRNKDGIMIGESVPKSDRLQLIAFGMAHQKPLYYMPDWEDIVLYQSNILSIDDMAIMSVKGLQMTLDARLLKRAMDMSLAIFLLILFSPLLMMVGLAVKMEDGGPVFYRQERVTRHRKRFMLIKFRTMIVDAEGMTGPVMACEKDKRVTAVGKLLRNTRLDEFPQLINVIKGEMSLVGPRPERPHFVERFEKHIANYGHRFQVKAGITGWAQVQGKYNTTPEDKLKFDLLYLTNYSLLLDMKILLQTIKIMCSPNRAQGV